INQPIVKPVSIPFENTTLPGYYCLADNSGKKRPLIIIHSGYDGTKEELYYTVGLPALQRGYNCLLFEGPGQGEVIRVQKLPFRPDWETVVTPVVDFALEQPEVDPQRIALMGISFGGYLAPRAAAFEPRIKVCIANGGIYDFHSNFVAHQPPGFEKELDNPEAAQKIDQAIYAEMAKNPGTRWVFNNGMFTFGAKTPSELVRMTRPYTMKGIADKIKCKMLVINSENDLDMPGQAIKLYDDLTSPKTYLEFTVEEGAEEHCQMGAAFISSERVYNWLDENL
ncbi:MAG: alpha/beta fold hydrolase, partial [Candidatus Margulisiibacteriota bacterium]